MFRLSIITLLLASALQLRAKDAYFLDVHSQGAAVAVTLNGFPLWEVANPDGQAFSGFVNPYLVSGKNELKIDYRIPENTTEEMTLPWIDCQIIKAPADQPRSTEVPGETVLKKRYDPIERRKLSSLAPEEYTLLSGVVPRDGGLFYFSTPSERRWAFGIQLTDKASALFEAPRAIELAGLTQSLVLAEVHLRQSKTGAHLAYDQLKFLRGGEQVVLSPGNLSKGVGQVGKGDFDTLWIFGFAAEGVEELRVLDFKLFNTPKPVSETIEFEVKLDGKWAWQNGAEITDLAAERESLLAFLRTLHTTIDTEPVEKWLPFFELKIQDLTQAMGRPAGEMAKAQEDYFKDLKSMKSWALEPFDAARLIFTKINPRVVAVSYLDSEGPIISIPLLRPGQEELDRFKIPLYLAKVNGTWTVVR